MKELLIILRSTQLIMHHAHNLCAGTTFQQDHEFFGDSYSAMESDYDDLIERIIGTQGTAGLELKSIMSEVMDLLPENLLEIKDNKYLYMMQLVAEKSICSKVEDLCKGTYSQGIKQMLGDMTQRSEIRQYKIQQRIK